MHFCKLDNKVLFFLTTVFHLWSEFSFIKVQSSKNLLSSLRTVHFLDSVLYLRLKVRCLVPKILYPKPSNTAEYVDEI
jgi:hypothetical protein